MSIRTDVAVNWELSPRLIEIEAGSTELSAQDSADTLRSLEHIPNPGFDVFSHDYIVEAAGKDDLGGGTQVGITLTYQDGQVAFARTASRSSGTATTGSSTQLIDNLADFVTDGVQRGDWVINFTDQSVTEVLSVVDLNTLNVRTLSDGTDNDFDIGDAYKVWAVEECQLSGGNQLAIDSADASISPLFTTFGRFAARTASSSATLQSQEELQAASFIGRNGLGVVIAPTDPNATSGTVFPTGTRQQPSDNVPDANTVGENRGFNQFFLKENLSISSGSYTDGYTWFGDNPTKILLTVSGTTDLTGGKFHELQYSGLAFTDQILWECIALNVSGMTGFIYKSACYGPIAVGAGVLNVVDCWDNNVSGTPVTFDMTDNASKLSVDNFKSGVIKITNLDTAGQYADININNCEVIIDATCTLDDAITIAGAGKVTNNSTAQIDTSNLFEPFGLDVIYIDTIDGTAGTQHPLGRKLDPVDNLTDATTILTANNAEEIRIRGQVTALQDYSYVDFIGKQEIVDFTAGLSGDSFNLNGRIYTGVTFQNLVLTGDMAGSTNCKFKNCYLLNVTGITGTGEYCGIGGDCSIEGGGYFSSTYTVYEGEPTMSLSSIDNTTFSMDSVSGYIFIQDMAGVNTLFECNLRGGEIDFDVPVVDGGGGTNTGGRIYTEGYGYSYQTEAELAAIFDEIWGWNLIDSQTSNRVRDMSQFKGEDADNPVSMSGDPATGPVVVSVDGKTKTITPTSITRT